MGTMEIWGIIFVAGFAALGLCLIIWEAIPVKIYIRSHVVYVHWMWAKISGVIFILYSILFYSNWLPAIHNWTLLFAFITLMKGIYENFKSEFLNDHPKKTRLYRRVLDKLFSEPNKD